MKLYEFFNPVIAESVESKAAYIAKSMTQKVLAAAKRNQELDPAAVRDLDDATGAVEQANNILNQIGQADPTPKGASMQWLANQYVNGQFRLEDVGRLREELEIFYKIRPKLDKKDLLQYTISELYDVVDEYKKTSDSQEPVTKRQQKAKQKAEGIDVIVRGPGYMGFEVKTHEAMCHYGAGTRWCTTQRDPSIFNSYTKGGTQPLYQFMVKDGNKTRKFLFHVESRQFMNERDQTVTASELKLMQSQPGFADFVTYIIDRHYS